MKFLPITLVATLSASLLMALIFVPTLGTLFGAPSGGADPDTVKAIAAGDQGGLHNVKGFTGAYLGLLRGALAHPGKVIVLALAVLIGAQIAYVQFGRGIEFFPTVEPENALLQVHARGNLSITERDALLRQVEERILSL